jgi:hypothetical protein
MKSFLKTLPITLLALCAMQTSFGQVLLQESFNASSMPATWNESNNGGNWTRVTSGQGALPHSGAGMAEFEPASGLVTGLLGFLLGSNSAVLVSPAVDFSTFASGSNVVSVWVYRQSKKTTNADRLEFYMNTAPNFSGATNLGTVHRSKTLSPVVPGQGWYLYSFPLPASFNTATSAYFMIKGIYAGGDKIVIDDISVSHCSNSVSATVTNLSCAGSENGSIDITVNNGTPPFTYEWTNDFGPFEWTEDISNLTVGTYGVKVVDALGCQAAGGWAVSQPVPLSFTANVTAVSCNAVAGDIVTTPSGGTQPYTYSWSGPNAFTATTKDIQAPPGLYSLTLTDSNGCASHGSYNIGQAIGVSGTLTHNVCFGGSSGNIALSVNGGTPPYNFAWSNNAQSLDNIGNLPAGSYSVAVTDPNNCLGTGTFIINEPTEITVLDTIKHVSCFGGSNGSINLGVSGGTPPYLFDWNIPNSTKNRSNLTAGTYQVTVIDANLCTKSFSYTVQEPALLTASNTKTDVLCYGSNTGAIDVSVNGGTAPYSYVWTNSSLSSEDRNNLTAASYTASVTDAKGCNTTTSATLTQPALLSVLALKTDILCNSEATGAIDITVSGGTAPYTFSWSSNQTSEDISGLTAGTYSVTITDANGCTKSASYLLSQPSMVNVTSSITNVNCFGGTTGKIDLGVNGGVSPYTYLWNNNATIQDLQNITAATYTVAVTDANGCTKQQSYTVSEPPLLVVTGSTTDILCNGASTGTINLTVAGGTPDNGTYDFTWNNGSHSQNRTGLIAGTYSVTVEDKKHCIATSSFTLTQPTPVVVTPTIGNLLCNSASTGSIDLAVTGGVAPYTYLWSNNGGTAASRSNLTAGTYAVTVTDANNCAHNKTYTITQPTAITVSKTVTNVSCNGGSNGIVDLSVTGGTAPYTYSWSNSQTSQDISGLTAGTYSVTVTDANGCTAITSATISEPAILSATGTQTNLLCNGANNATIDLTVTGGTTPYTYNWGAGAPITQDRTALIAGTYNVTVSDAKGCSAAASFTITQPTAVSVSATTVNVACNGAATGSLDLIVSGGVAPYTYLWNTSATSSSVSGLTAGTYTVTVKDANNCSKSLTAVVIQPSALSLTKQVTNVTCYGLSNGNINITTGGGVTPYTYNWSNSATTEDLNGIPAGSYTVIMTDANGCTKTTSSNVTEPAMLLASGTQNNISCNSGSNGSIDLSVTGGTSPYTYNWGANGPTTQDRTGLLAGSYNVTVTDAKGCITNASFNLTQPDMIVVTPTVTNVLCKGANTGAIAVAVSGGTGSYTYLWSNNATSSSITGLAANTYTVTVKDANNCSKTTSASISQPTAIALSQNSVHVSCKDNSNGSIDLNVTGGTGSYNYLWSNAVTSQDLSNLNAGSYNVTVTDANNCTKSATYTITEPAYLVVAGTVANVTCKNGSNGGINITAAGGTQSYAYLWNDAITSEDRANLTAGTYTVTVTDAKGCMTTSSFNVGEPTEVMIAGNTSAASCNGTSNGAIALIVTGGTGSYTYKWNTNATTSTINGLGAGTYAVTVKDANLCSKTASFVVSQPDAIIISGNVTDASCNGGSNGAIDITATGGVQGFSYNWGGNITSEDISGKNSGNYSVVVTDANGCTKSGSFTIAQPAPISITGTTTSPLCFGGNNGSINISTTGGTGAHGYNWSNNSTTEDISGLTEGTYTVTVTDANSCVNAASFTVVQPAQLAASTTVANVSCFGGNNGSILINATGGTGAYTYSVNNLAATQNPTGLTAGSYQVVVADVNGCSYNTSATIAEPALLTISGSTTNVVCNGANTGAIGLSVNGGTAPYTYSWSNNATSMNISGIGAGSYTVTVTDAKGCSQMASFNISQPDALSITTIPQHLNCNGINDGAITVNAAGGTGVLTYTWNNASASGSAPTGLAAGNYVVTVTDANGCTKSASTTLLQLNAAMAMTATVANVSCNGGTDGSITLSATGGVAPYTYKWNNGTPCGNPVYSGLVAGTYPVNVTDANGCQQTASFTITQPTAVSISASKANVACNGNNTGSINLTVAGGTGAYSYSWSNGSLTEDINGIPAGSYTVTVSDANACSATMNYSISQPTAVVLSAATTQVSCNGGNNGSITLSVSGGIAPYTYQWNNNGGNAAARTILTAGTYTVSVTDANQCSISGSYTISEPSVISTSVTSSNPTCFGGSNGSIKVAVSGGTAPYTYLWNNGGTADSRTGLTTGSYTVTITDANGCMKTASSTLGQPAVISATATITNVSCNGSATGAINITSAGGTGNHSYSWSNNSTTEDISGLSAGTYTVTISDASGCTNAVPFTVNQPAPLAITNTYTMANCATCTNGGVNATVTGGTAPYTYLWSNNATTEDISGVTHGTYTITVTDSKGCTASKSGYVAIATSNLGGTVTMSPLYPVSPGGAASTIYLGYGPSTVTLTATGNLGIPPYTFAWPGTSLTSASRSVSPTVTTMYTVQIKDATNTIITRTYTVNVIDPRNGNKYYVCHNGNNTLSLSGSALAAHLNHGDLLGSCANYTGAKIMHEEHEEAQIKIYPNPSTGLFTLEVPFEGDDIDVLITDLQGKIVETKSIKENWEPKHQFDLRTMAKGVYLIHAKSEHQTFKEKLLVQ